MGSLGTARLGTSNHFQRDWMNSVMRRMKLITKSVFPDRSRRLSHDEDEGDPDPFYGSHSPTVLCPYYDYAQYFEICLIMSWEKISFLCLRLIGTGRLVLVPVHFTWERYPIAPENHQPRKGRIRYDKCC